MSRALDFNDGFSSASEPNAIAMTKILANQDIGASGTISVNNVSFQLVKVTGDAGAQSASTTPFSGSTIPDGSIIMLLGQDDTNTVTISHNDNDGGCILFGNATLKESYILKLIYDSTADRFYEITRNFA